MLNAITIESALVAAFLYRGIPTVCPTRTPYGGGSKQRRLTLRAPAWFEHLPDLVTPSPEANVAYDY